MAAVQMWVINSEGLPLLLRETLSCCSAVAPSLMSTPCICRLIIGCPCIAQNLEKASIKWKPCKPVFIWLLLHLMNMFSLLSRSFSPINTQISCWILPFSLDFWGFFYTSASNGFVTLAYFLIIINTNLVCFRRYTLYFRAYRKQFYLSMWHF